MADRSGITQIDGDQHAEAPVITLAGSTADELMVWRNNTGATVKVNQAGYTPDTAVTGADTNNFELRFKVKTAAGAAAANLTAAKEYSSGVDIVQFVEDTQTLSTTAADLLVDDGECITLDVAKNGTGLAFPAGLASVEYEFV